MDKDSDTNKQPIPEYGMYVKRDGGMFTLMIPELGIARRNQDLNEGFRELTVAKEEYFSDLAGSGLHSFIPKPESPAGSGILNSPSGNFSTPYFSFFMRVAIVMLLLLGFGGIGTVIAGNILVKNLSRTTSIIKSKLESLPDDKVENYAQQIHRIGNKLKPVIYELKLAWQTEQKYADVFQNESMKPPASP